MYDFIVTGGCGFIGSHFIELVLSKGYTVLNIDKMTYVSWNNIGFEKRFRTTIILMNPLSVRSKSRFPFRPLADGQPAAPLK